MKRAFACGCIFFLLLLWCHPVFPGDEPAGWLVINNANSKKSFEIDVRDALTMTIRFFHSYDRQWVEETFILKKEGFVPHEVLYSDDSYDFRDQRYDGDIIIGDRAIRITHIKSPKRGVLKRIISRVAYTKPQELIIKRKKGMIRVLFTNWGDPGHPILFSLK